jgi:hypothetical protein
MPGPQIPIIIDRFSIVRVATAAKIVDTDRRTIYNYAKKDKVQVFKVAGREK